MKKIISILLACIITSMIPICSCADVTDLKWGMSRSEVVRIMGQPNRSEKMGSVDQLIYENYPISSFEGFCTLFMADGNLIGRGHELYDLFQARFNYLSNALDQKYGKYSVDISSAADFFEFVFSSILSNLGVSLARSDIETVAQLYVDRGEIRIWKSKDTVIVLWNSSSTCCWLIYFQSSYLNTVYNYKGL